MSLWVRSFSQSAGRLFGVMLLVMFASAAQAELKTVPAELAALPQEYRLDGLVEAVHQSTLSAQTSGQVQELLVDVDDYVEAGAIILRLKDTEQKARVSQAKASLQAANARRQAAQKEFSRVQGIFARKLVSKSEMDQATSALQTTTADQKSAQAALRQAEEQLAYTQVRAPFTGIVTQRHIEAGETAQPGQPLISGLSLDQLRVNVDVPQSLVVRVREQGAARVLIPTGDWVAVDKLTIFPYADPASGTFKVRVVLPAGIKDIFPGMLLKVAFTTGGEQQLTVPLSTVVHRSEVTGLYVVDAQGKVTLRHVRLGRRLEDRVVVLSGLVVGEQVALNPIAAVVVLKQQRGA